MTPAALQADLAHAAATLRGNGHDISSSAVRAAADLIESQAARIAALEAGARGMLAALLALDAEHVMAADVSGCQLCWPGDGHWPCVSRMEIDELLDLLRAATEDTP